ncbi:MAG: methyltransferase domain-containing protein [Myxococcales bacterium]|nr:methyltransferase domain-containing protein [Myxococcales bacterium]
MTEIDYDPLAEVRCEHASQCGACPLIAQPHAAQWTRKTQRVESALSRYALDRQGAPLAHGPTPALEAYRRRSKLVVARGSDGVSRLGLHRRNENEGVVDVPGCRVLRPSLHALIAELRALIADAPAELSSLLEPSGRGRGVLEGIDVREVTGPAEGGWLEGDGPAALVTFILVGERLASVEALTEAARALRRRLPRIVGVAVSPHYQVRQQGNTRSEFVVLTGASEYRDALPDEGGTSLYQYVSHTSFLHAHGEQAARYLGHVGRVVSEALAGAMHDREAAPARVLDLYGGTGALALTLAARGYSVTTVESFPPNAALAKRAARAQRLPVELVVGDVASVTLALAGAGAKFDAVIVNPPRRGLSPAAREAIVALAPPTLVYAACDLDNLCRDAAHLERIGLRMSSITAFDMLPLTDDVELVAVFEPAPLPRPIVLYQGSGIVVLDKPPHEPAQHQPDYPGCLVTRARRCLDGGDWLTVLEIEAGTSGVTMFARDRETARRWRQALEKTGRLVYLAAVRGITAPKGAIARDLSTDDGLRMARTRYRRIALGGGHSILRVVPEQPVRHQIRRHFASLGHPLLGDMRYGHAPTNRYFEEKHGLDRSFLHLVRVELDHPDTAERVVIEAPLSPDLRAVIARASDASVLRFLESKHALGDGGTRLRSALDGPFSDVMPESEPFSAGTLAELAAPAVSLRDGRAALEPEDAPRTIRGELLHGDSEDL